MMLCFHFPLWGLYLPLRGTLASTRAASPSLSGSDQFSSLSSPDHQGSNVSSWPAYRGMLPMSHLSHPGTGGQISRRYSHWLTSVCSKRWSHLPSGLAYGKLLCSINLTAPDRGPWASSTSGFCWVQSSEVSLVSEPQTTWDWTRAPGPRTRVRYQSAACRSLISDWKYLHLAHTTDNAKEGAVVESLLKTCWYQQLLSPSSNIWGVAEI